MATDNPFTLTFKLKQHTPIIHFQHEQAGATLRATEVKPKLDKFLIKKMGALEKIPDAWKVGGKKAKHEALDYKLKVEPVQPKFHEIGKREKLPAFFANMGDGYESNPKALSFIEHDFQIHFLCFHPDLKNLLEEHFPSFLSVTNFGTRQSKGFGSFYLSENDPLYKSPHATISFTVNTSGHKDWIAQSKELFFHLDLFYRAMRSGINIPGRAKATTIINHKGEEEVHLEAPTEFYCKAFLFSFLKSKGIQWDKKSIKERYFSAYAAIRRRATRRERENLRTDFVYEKGVSEQKKKWPGSDILHFPGSPADLLFRDMFGLSTEEKWHSYGVTIQKKHMKQDRTGGWVTLNEKDSLRISRFKSPISFKPIRETNSSFRVYISYNEPPSEYRNQRFLIDCSRVPRGVSNLELTTPTASHFTFKDFFDFITDKSKLDISTHINSKYHPFRDRDGYSYYSILKNIIDQIQK